MVDDAARQRDFYRSLVELSTEDDPSAVLSKALALLVEVTDAREAYVELHAPERPDWPGWWRADGCESDRIDAIRAKLSHGVIAEVLRSGSEVEANAALDPRFKDNQSVRDHAIEGVFCAPIGSRPPLGAIYLQGKRVREADALGDPLENARFSSEVMERVRVVARAVARSAELFVRRESEAARLEASGDAFGGVIHKSAVMRELVKQLAFIAPRDVRVLLTGPSGSGKTMLARAIHEGSARASGPFVDLNCAAIPESLVENELFGHVAGAYSSARAEGKGGHVEAAHRGTLFLDEIAELTLASQSKLLRFLDDGRFTRLGSTASRTADVRVISATNVDLAAAVAAGRFREDLLFRLQGFSARVPPLSERREDLILLARAICSRLARQMNIEVRGIGPEALQLIQTREWRGNVRELENALRQGLLKAGIRGSDSLEPVDLTAVSEPPVAMSSRSLHEVTERFQRDHVLAVLEANDWSVSDAARDLNVARSYLYTLKKNFGLQRT